MAIRRVPARSLMFIYELVVVHFHGLLEGG